MRDKFFQMAQGKVMKQTRGNYPAPIGILTVVKTGLEQGTEKGYEMEARVND